MIIFILVAFLLSTALTSIMYLGGNKDASMTGENLTGVTDATGIVETLGTGELLTGTETIATGETK